MLRHMSGLLIGLSLIAFPASAHAQGATVEQAREHADALITEAGAGQWFTNITDSEVPRVRHEPSGMTCSFATVDPRNTLRLYPVMPNGPAQGDDVGCGAWWDNTFISMIASRYPDDPPEDTVISWAVAELHQNWANIEPYLPDFQVATFGDQSVPRVVVFTADRGDRAASNALVMRNIDGWTFKLRATGPVDEVADISSIATFIYAISIPGGWDAFQAETPEED